MKRFTMIMALVAMMVVPVFAERVTPETACKVATTFLNSYGVKAELHLIDYADRKSFPNFYVFGTEDNFVIISADDCVEPVLGYSTENPFGTEKMPENLFWWLKGYDEQIADAAKSGQKATSETAQQWKELVYGNITKAHSEVIVGPLIQTQWNQGAPYNNLCPGGNSTGCVATAMAQIMKYWTTVYESEMYETSTGFWSYLKTGFGSHSYTPAAHPEYGEQSVDFWNITYDWRNMISSYSGTYNETQANAIATLMYHCGVSVNMNYGSNGTSSGALTPAVSEALKSYFNYNQSAEYIIRSTTVDETGQEDSEQWKDMLKAELTANPPRPIQYSGTGSGAHSFICDGYNSDDKFHFNWGWGGKADGYFLITNLNPNGHNYNNDQEAVIGIQPISYNAQPSQLTASVSGRNVSLIWEEVQDVSSYNVYRDYSFIGNTSSNGFIDSQALVGNHVYYFRCVDTDGNVSLPSNTQSVNVEFGYTLEELRINNLEVSYNNGDANLQWEAPINLNHVDFYSFEGAKGSLSIGNINTFYWGARFPSSMLTNGTSISSVSTYFYTSGIYTAYVYKCTGAKPSGEPISVSGTYSVGWHTIPIEPITINNDQNDIWVIFKSTGIAIPTIFGNQNSDQGNYYSTNGTSWNHFAGYSFFVSASLIDGNFTYTLYDNGTSIAENLNVPIYTLSNITSNTAHQYAIKTKLGDEETEASNMAGVTVGSASLANLELGDNDNMTIAPNSTLTVTGTLSNTDPANLILKNGAQLIHNSEGVKATVQKSIASHEGNPKKGWYFISSPITEEIIPNSSNGLLFNDYDLYFYEEYTHMWRNHKEQIVNGENQNAASNFNVEHKKGYLYANADNVTLKLAGTLNASTNDPTIDVYAASTDKLTGFNLVGNPFARELNINDLALVTNNNVSHITGIYQISDNKVVASQATTIAPCEGFFIQAEESGTLHFNYNWANYGNTNYSDLKIEVMTTTRDDALLDRAYVNFGEGKTLDKFVFDAEATKLYIPQNGKDYAIAFAEKQGEMPINFKANEDGNYTFMIVPENVELISLLLIDNLTGDVIDLLTTPSYTFEAKTNDYESRFRLLFVPKESEEITDNNCNFAFIFDDKLIIGSEGINIVQIIDINGRILKSNHNTSYINLGDLMPGVYVVRLIEGEKTKTQKIVIQ